LVFSFSSQEFDSMSTSTDATTPSETPSAAQPIDRDKVLEVLAFMRPYLQADGGDVELVDITPEGVVQVRLQGACGTCPSSTYTLKMGLEEQLRQHVAGVTEVVSV
jgi:Fe-S cluster biogenesis protein NfuA